MKTPDERLRDGRPPGPRSWWASALPPAAALGAAIAVSAVVNPLLGRYVHWDWVAVGAPIAYAFLVIAFRRRWV